MKDTLKEISKQKKKKKSLRNIENKMNKKQLIINKPTANEDGSALAAKRHGIDAPKVPGKAPQRARRGHIPQEDLLVAPNAGEAGIVIRHSNVEHLVAVGIECLHQRR